MPEHRRSFVLLAVLVVIGGATLVATMLVHFAGAENAVAYSSAERARSRALASSGIRVILSELDWERDRILSGRSVSLDSQYVLHEDDLEMGVIRLIPPESSGDLVRPVGGLLDLNRVAVDDLVATGLIEPTAAEAIVSARERRPGRRFRTLEDLLQVRLADGTPAVTPEQLIGPLDAFVPSRDVLATELDRGERVLEALGSLEATTLEEVLTVHSFEPALQRSGVLRINLNVPFTETLGRRMDDRFGEGTGEGLGRVMENVTFDDDKRIVDVLRFFETPIEDWNDILDALTTDERWHMGRIDLNTAPAEVIQTLEGVDAGMADAIVEERAGLTSEELATRTWPVLRNLIEPTAFAPIAGRVTTRCWTWRVRMAAGTVSVEDPEGPMRSPVILDLVVDLAAPVPRIAALRDISGLEVGVRLYERQESMEIGDPLSEGRTDALDRDSIGSTEGMEDGLFDREGFMDSFESAFSDRESAFDDESVFDDRDPFFDDESTFSDGDEGSDDPEPGAPSGTGRGPTGRWSPR